MRKILFLLLILFISSYQSVFANPEQAQHCLHASLPEYLCIDSYYIDGKKIPPSEKYPRVSIQKVIKIDDKNNLIELSGFQIKVKTNGSGPVCVNADFQSLIGKEYKFSEDDLSVCPPKAQITDLSQLSTKFTPKAKVGCDVKKGDYIGKMVFTIGTL